MKTKEHAFYYSYIAILCLSVLYSMLVVSLSSCLFLFLKQSINSCFQFKIYLQWLPLLLFYVVLLIKSIRLIRLIVR